MSTLQTPLADALYSIITGDSAIVAIVDTRIFPTVAPAGTVGPWIVYQRISNVTTQTHTDADAYRSARYQVSAYALDQHTVEELRELLLARLDGYDSVVGGSRVVITHENDTDFFEEESKYYSAQIDFFIQR